MKAISSNYSGRLVDIEMLHTVADMLHSQEVQLSLTFRGTKYVTGMEKLIQQYTKLLLTKLDETLFYSSTGCEFTTKLFTGNMPTPGALVSAFAAANADVLNQMGQEAVLTEVYGTIPDDEIISDAKLVDYDVDYDRRTIYLRVAITNQAGDDYTFIVPAGLRS